MKLSGSTFRYYPDDDGPRVSDEGQVCPEGEGARWLSFTYGTVAHWIRYRQSVDDVLKEVGAARTDALLRCLAGQTRSVCLNGEAVESPTVDYLAEHLTPGELLEIVRSLPELATASEMDRKKADWLSRSRGGTSAATVPSRGASKSPRQPNPSESSATDAEERGVEPARAGATGS